MATTRRNFFMGAAPAIAAGAFGFPALAGGKAGEVLSPSTPPPAVRIDVPSPPLKPPPVQPDSGVASNGYLWSLLPPGRLRELREINVGLTKLAIQQCDLHTVANQIEFDTRICDALATFLIHGVSPEDLVAISGSYDVVFRWSLMYGDARMTFNARFFRLPLAIAFPRTVGDLVFWVNFVRDHQLSVSIRSGNNCYESFSIDNEIVIDLTFLTLTSKGADQQFRLDPAAGLVHVAPGVRLGVLYTELAKLGVRIGGGQCSPVCIGGLLGTGGVGFSTRELGYMCDQLVEVEYVLADGSIVVANAGNQYADLFRATKGAGAAGLGVMTRLSVQVVPIPPAVLFYTVYFYLKDAAVVLEKWQNLAATAPDALSSVANLTPAGALADQAVFFINGEYPVTQGSVAQARQDLETLLRTGWLNQVGFPPLDFTIEAVPWTQAATNVALQVPQPLFNQWKLKSNFVFQRLSAAQLQPLVNFLFNNAPGGDPTRAIGALTFLLGGGKANRVDPNSAVVPARAGTVSWVHGGALWNEQPLEPQCLAFVDALFNVLAPIVSKTSLYGIPDLQLGSQLADPPDFSYLQAFWSSPTANFVPFLLGVKQRYDSQNVFQFAQSIPARV
jgi:hypothetical protein